MPSSCSWTVSERAAGSSVVRLSILLLSGAPRRLPHNLTAGWSLRTAANMTVPHMNPAATQDESPRRGYSGCVTEALRQNFRYTLLTTWSTSPSVAPPPTGQSRHTHPPPPAPTLLPPFPCLQSPGNAAMETRTKRILFKIKQQFYIVCLNFRCIAEGSIIVHGEVSI